MESEILIAELRKQFENVGFDGTEHPMHLYVSGGQYAATLFASIFEQHERMKSSLEKIWNIDKYQTTEETLQDVWDIANETLNSLKQ